MADGFMKMCPQCRKRNDASNETCTCGASLLSVKAVPNQVNVSMFGGPPPQLDVKPLEKSAPASSAACSYNTQQASSKEKQEDRAELLVYGASVGQDTQPSWVCTTYVPAKPW